MGEVLAYQGLTSQGQGLPARGYLDSYHPGLGPWPFDTSEWSEELVKTALALRLNKVEELLLARKGYLELLHPDDSHVPYLIVPREVKDVFLQGPYQMVQVAHLVKQLEEGTKNSNKERIENRKKVFESLTLFSLSLVQMDRLIRFFSEEIFEGNDSFDRMVKKSVKERGTATYWGGFPSWMETKKIRQELREKLAEKLKISEVLENILAQKAFMLNRYPLLGVEVKDLDCHIYQCIYQELQRKLKLPNLRMQMSSNYIDFKIAREIKIHHTFQRQLENNLKIMADNRQNILQFVEPLYDRGIRLSLEGNFNFLQDLCREGYFWDNFNPYLIMALDHSNWEKLLSGDGFFWIDKEVLIQGKKELLALLNYYGEREKLKEQVLRYAAHGIMGLGTVALLAGWIGPVGPVAMAVIRGVTQWTFLSSGALYAGKAWLISLNNKRYAKLAENLYIGSVRNTSYQIKEDHRIILKQNYRDIAFAVSSVIFILGGSMIQSLSNLLQPVVAVTKGGVVLTQRSIKFLQGRLALARNAVLMRFPHFGNLLSRASNLLGSYRDSLGSFHKNFSRLINHNAAKVGMTSQDIVGKVHSHSMLSRAIKQVVGDFSAFKSSFVRREVIVKFLASLYSEIVVRGEDFLREIDYVALNISFSLFMTFRISAQVSKDFSSNILKNAKGLFFPSIISSALFTAGNTLINIKNGNDISHEEALKAVEACALMMVTSIFTSPLRAQLVGGKLNKMVEKFYGRRFTGVPTGTLKVWASDAKVALAIYSRMLVSVPLIYLMKKRGIQSKDKFYGSGIVYSYNESNSENVKFLFPVILGVQEA